MNPMEFSGTGERMLCQQAAAKRMPVNGSFELTPLCNMNCDMCYVRLSPEEMMAQGRLRTLDEWVSLIPEMQKAGVLFLLLTGGEPLLYPQFKELYLALKKAGMILTVNTNATLLDEEWADFFAQNKPRRINITLYGGSDETYRRLCHHPEGFTRTTKAIRLLKERGIEVKVSCSLTRLNRMDWEKVIAFGKEVDVPVRMDTYMYPAVRERSLPYNEQVRMDPLTAAKMHVEVLRAEMGEETFRQAVPFNLAKIDPTPVENPEGMPMRCLAGACSFTINWQGNMRPCVVMDEPSVPVFEKGFLESWKEITEHVRPLRTSVKCAGCEYRYFCTTCVSAAKCETGEYDGVPEYLCTYTKEIARLMREYDEMFKKEA